MLDTVALVREFRDRQRERGRFNFQRVAVDSAMAVGLLAVGWLGVKVGLGLYEFTKIVEDPVGAAEDAARGIEIADVRKRLARLKSESATKKVRVMGDPMWVSISRKVKAGDPAVAKAIAKEEGRLAELMGEQEEVDEVEETPGIPVLRKLDRYLALYGPLAPVTIMGGNILMEVLRMRKVRRDG